MFLITTVESESLNDLEKIFYDLQDSPKIFYFQRSVEKSVQLGAVIKQASNKKEEAHVTHELKGMSVLSMVSRQQHDLLVASFLWQPRYFLMLEKNSRNDFFVASGLS